MPAETLTPHDARAPTRAIAHRPMTSLRPVPQTTSSLECRLLIVKADRLYAEILAQQVTEFFRCMDVMIVSRINEARVALASGRFDLILTGVTLLDGDMLDLLSTLAAPTRRVHRVLVVTERKDLRVLETLRALPVDGVFDPSSEGLDAFERAVRAIAGGLSYWSDSVLARLTQHCLPSNSLCRLLTPAERLVLAVIGDGSDNDAAAQRLGIRASSVHSIRRELHRKLGVTHRGDLVRIAAQHGFVRFTPDGVVRPGFALLVDACRARPLSTDISGAPNKTP